MCSLRPSCPPTRHMQVEVNLPAFLPSQQPHQGKTAPTKQAGSSGRPGSAAGEAPAAAGPKPRIRSLFGGSAAAAAAGPESPGFATISVGAVNMERQSSGGLTSSTAGQQQQQGGSVRLHCLSSRRLLCASNRRTRARRSPRAPARAGSSPSASPGRFRPT